MGLTIAIRRNLRCSRYTREAVDSVQHSKYLHTNEPPSASSKSAVKACGSEHQDVTVSFARECRYATVSFPCAFKGLCLAS